MLTKVEVIATTMVNQKIMGNGSPPINDALELLGQTNSAAMCLIIIPSLQR